MKHRAIICVVAVGAWLCGSGSQAVERSVESERRASLLEQLRSADVRAVGAVFSDLAPERGGTIAALLELARDKQPDVLADSRKCRAIELLGQYRARGAVDLLVSQIDYLSASPPLRGVRSLGYYAAAGALLEIGEPAMRRILIGRMGTQNTEQQMKICAYVLWCHHRPADEQEVGLFRMQRVLERERAQNKKHRQDLGIEPRPSVREKNLTRLIEIYTAPEMGNIKDWPRPSKEDVKRLREKWSAQPEQNK